MRTLYSIGIFFYSLAVRLASLFNNKAALMCTGWKQWLNILSAFKTNCENSKIAWFHAASLGEFEQARPVLEKFRSQHPDYKVCLTFFSPSGYEVRKNYSLADAVMYLPPDTRINARRLVETMKPNIAFFVKYEFWFNYLHQLQKNNTPTYLFSAIFRPSQYFFKWYGRWFAKQLHCYNHIFVQNNDSLSLLRTAGMQHCSLAGDTRFDRVADIAKQAKVFPPIESFIDNDIPVLMAGSSWEPDEKCIKDFFDRYDNPIKVILAPHVISENHLSQIEKMFGSDNCIRYSQFNTQIPSTKKNILIIDNIGMLSSLYRYATIACVGGGFGKGIHNVLEAAIFAKPVCFGPNHAKFKEAVDLLHCGAAKSFDNSDQLYSILSSWLDNANNYQSSAEAAKKYMDDNLGSTDIILNQINAIK